MKTAWRLTSPPTPRVERMPGVGGELDAGADLANCGPAPARDAEILAREGERGGETAMPPPATITGFSLRAALISGNYRSSEEHRNAVELAFGVHEIHALVRDPEAFAGSAQVVLDQGAPDALALVSPFDHLQCRVHLNFRIF